MSFVTVCWLLAHSYRVSKSPRLHPEFHYAVKKLPSKYSPDSKQHFYKLIDTFGTHYITKVTTGGGGGEPGNQEAAFESSPPCGRFLYLHRMSARWSCRCAELLVCACR